MIFRVNHENYIYHMIDYFTKEELANLSYLLISAKMRNQGTAPNVVKCNDLYPSSDILSNYIQLEDRKLFHKMYYKELQDTENIVYRMIVDPILLHHHNIVLMSSESEDLYIDVLCDFLNKEFGMKVIDLDMLFKTGETDLFIIDKKLVRNNSVELKRKVVRERIRSAEKTEEGRAKLLSLMSKDDKIKKLKELGIRVDKNKDDLTELLRLEWVIAGD